MVAPCKDCKDRYVSCHSTCERYKDRRKHFDEEKERILKIRHEELDFTKRKMAGIRKMKKGEAIRELKNRNYS